MTYVRVKVMGQANAVGPTSIKGSFFLVIYSCRQTTFTGTIGMYYRDIQNAFHAVISVDLLLYCFYQHDDGKLP